MIQANRRLNNRGRNVTLRVDANYNNNDNTSLSWSDVHLYDPFDPEEKARRIEQQLALDSTYQTNRYNLTPSKSWSYNLQATYSEPIAKQMFLQLSYRYQHSYNESDRSTYDFSAMGRNFFNGIVPAYRSWDDYLSRTAGPLESYKADSLSRYSEYTNDLHDIQLTYRWIDPQFQFNAGVMVQPQRSHYLQDFQGVHVDTVRNVTNFSPTLDFRYRFSKVSNLRINYRGTTQQPGMTDLLDITDDSDPLNITVGNAGLKPSFTQNFSLRFNNYYPKHQRFVFANLSFSTTSNSVTSKVVYDPLTGGRTSTRDNINGNWNTRGELMFNTALDTLGRFNMNSRTTAAYTHSVSYLDANRDGSIMKNAVNETVLGERLGFSYRNDWFEFEPNGAVNYTFGRNKLQAQGNQDTWNFSYGFNTTAQLPWGMQLTTNLNMTSRRGFSDESMNTNELIWNAQIAQSFLRGKPLSVRLEFYDILGQQSSFTRTLNAMMRSDSESNAINSYVMLRVNYRLNLFAGMGNMGGGRGGRGGSGGFGGGRGGRGGGGFGGPGRF